MKKPMNALFAMAAVSTILMMGCMSKVRYPSYYTLQLAPTVDPPPKADQLPSIAVRELRAPSYLREGPIVYLTSPEQIGFYQYHRWAVDPRRVVTDSVVERLRASGDFAEVRIYDGRADVDYIFSGRLDKLEEIDYEGGVQVEVAISGQVLDLRTGKTVWSNSVSDKTRVDQRNVPTLVAQMSGVTDRALEKLLHSLALPAATALR